MPFPKRRWAKYLKTAMHHNRKREHGREGTGKTGRQKSGERERHTEADGIRFQKNEMQFFSSSLDFLMGAFALLEIILCLI